MAERLRSKKEFLKLMGVAAVGCLLAGREAGTSYGTLDISRFSGSEKEKIVKSFRERSFFFNNTLFAPDSYKGVLVATNNPDIYRLTSLAHILDPVCGGEATIMGTDFLIKGGFWGRKIVIGLFAFYLTAGDSPVAFQSVNGFDWQVTPYPLVRSELPGNPWRLARQSPLNNLSLGKA